MTFAEIPDRNAAEAARGIVLSADVDAAETPEDPDEFYDHQLIGLAAYDERGSHLGEVTSVVHGGAQDLLAIRTPDGRDTLVPFVKALVPEVDLPGVASSLPTGPAWSRRFPRTRPRTRHA